MKGEHMSTLKKLLKTTDGLQEEIDAVVAKAVDKANKDAAKAAKTTLKDLAASVKEHDGVDKASKKVVADLIKSAQAPF